MLRYITGIFAVAIAIFSVAFTKPSVKTIKTTPGLTNFYFQFVGTINSQEGDVTKWNNITATQYAGLSCLFAHDGCALIATSTQQVSGITRPANIYLITGTNDPTTGANVSTVANLQSTR
jgi:hypothetical protein